MNKEIAIWVLYWLFCANPYGYAHIGPKWDPCRHTHVGLPRMVPDGSHITALLGNTNSYVCTYFQLNFVLFCDHLDLNCYYLVKNSN